jgi:hypothetical protein
MRWRRVVGGLLILVGAGVGVYQLQYPKPLYWAGWAGGASLIVGCLLVRSGGRA